MYVRPFITGFYKTFFKNMGVLKKCGTMHLSPRTPHITDNNLLSDSVYPDYYNHRSTLGIRASQHLIRQAGNFAS